MLLHPREIGVFGGVLQADDGCAVYPFLLFCGAIDMDAHGVFGEHTGEAILDNGKAPVLAGLPVEDEGIHMHATVSVVGIGRLIVLSAVGMLVPVYTAGQLSCGGKDLSRKSRRGNGDLCGGGYLYRAVWGCESAVQEIDGYGKLS